jgi:hypothetical protein
MHDVLQDAPARNAEDRAADAASPPPVSWRDTIQVHPVAELFPLMGEAELGVLAADIKANGLVSPIALWRASKDAQAELLDGRNRLDAIERELGRPVRIVTRTYRGRTTWSLEANDEDGNSTLIVDLIGDGFGVGIDPAFVVLESDIDPWKYVASINLHRRHLTAEQKRAAITKLLEVIPERSDRGIADMVKASPTTVGNIRAKISPTVHGGQLLKRVGKDNKTRRQPVRERAEEKTSAAVVTAVGTEKTDEPEISAAFSGHKVNKPEEVVDATSIPAPAPSMLADKARRLEIENVGLRSEIEELQAATAQSAADLKAALSRLSVAGVLHILPDTTKRALTHRAVEHLSAAELLDALERKLPGSPPSVAVRGAISTLRSVIDGCSDNSVNVSAARKNDGGGS